LRFKRDVDRAPPDVAFRGALFDDTLVFWRTTRFDSRVGNQRAVFSDMGILLVEYGVLVKSPRWQVAVDLLHGELVFLQIECVHAFFL